MNYNKSLEILNIPKEELANGKQYIKTRENLSLEEYKRLLSYNLSENDRDILMKDACSRLEVAQTPLEKAQALLDAYVRGYYELSTSEETLIKEQVLLNVTIYASDNLTLNSLWTPDGDSFSCTYGTLTLNEGGCLSFKSINGNFYADTIDVNYGIDVNSVNANSYHVAIMGTDGYAGISGATGTKGTTGNNGESHWARDGEAGGNGVAGGNGGDGGTGYVATANGAVSFQSAAVNTNTLMFYLSSGNGGTGGTGGTGGDGGNGGRGGNSDRRSGGVGGDGGNAGSGGMGGPGGANGIPVGVTINCGNNVNVDLSNNLQGLGPGGAGGAAGTPGAGSEGGVGYYGIAASGANGAAGQEGGNGQSAKQYAPIVVSGPTPPSSTLDTQ